MAIPLKYATASQIVPLGRFLDSTDGNAEETGLTIANTDIKLWKWGATSLANKNSGGATHMATGSYYCTLDATDTNTYGPMKIEVHVAGALYTEVWCHVMAPVEWDRQFSAFAQGLMGIKSYGTAQSATSTTVVLASAESNADDIANGMTILAYGSTQGYWQARQIVDFTNSTDTVTVDAWTVTPSGTISYVIILTPPAIASGTLPAVNVTQFGGSAGTFASGIPAVNATQLSGDTTAADNAEAFFDGTGYAGTNNVIPTVTTTTTATNVTTVNGIAANAITATSIASNAITSAKIASGAITTATFAAGAINAAAIASDAITDAKVASDVTIASVTGSVGSVTGAVGSVTGNVGGNVVGSVGDVLAIAGQTLGVGGGDPSSPVGVA